MKDRDDKKSSSISALVAQMLADMMDRGYGRIDGAWELRSVDGSKVVDGGKAVLRRGGDGAFLVRITDRYTGK